MVNPKIAQHYSPDEKIFLDKAEDWLDRCLTQQIPVTTPFLNPRQAEILRQLAANAAVSCETRPSDAEYVKAVVSPDWYDGLTDADFDLTLFDISYPRQFKTLTHGQILGTFLGETGLDRSQLGDILMTPDRTQIYASKRLTQAFMDSVKKIAGVSVKLKEVPLDAAVKPFENVERKVILVSSRRLDKFIAESLSITRNLAANMVQSNQVKVNFAPQIRPDKLVEVGDLLSVKGFGRVKCLSSLGFTKKDKEKVEIELTLNRRK